MFMMVGIYECITIFTMHFYRVMATWIKRLITYKNNCDEEKVGNLSRAELDMEKPLPSENYKVEFVQPKY